MASAATVCPCTVAISGARAREPQQGRHQQQQQHLQLRSFSRLGRPGLPQLRRLCPPSLSRTTAWFKFGKDAEKAGIYASQGRNDFDRDDVEQYFNYMGMLATEGTYDKMEALLSKGIHPVDILLLLAASEGDKPKIQELMRAGAKYDVTDVEGRTALDRAQDEEVRQYILSFS